MDEKKVIELAKSIYIKPSKEVINLTLNLYKNVKDGLQDLEEKLSKKVENYKPLARVSDTIIDFNSLREDKEDDSFKLELPEILNNASSTKDDYIVTKKAQNED